MIDDILIEKLVHGGQGLGTLPDGRKVFVWGALPGERARLHILKGKRSYAEAIAEEIVEASPLRVEPREANYLATSPWQILDFAAENDYKQRIIAELFTQHHVSLPAFLVDSAGDTWHYRNKMEYSFWGDDSGLHMALYDRGTHRKHVVEGSVLALPAVDAAARAVCRELQGRRVRAGELKSLVVRASQNGQAAVALMVKSRDFPGLPLLPEVAGLRVYYSNPKSPAAVRTELLSDTGSAVLSDALLKQSLDYDVDSFFQVNVPVFEAALQRIKEYNVDAATVMDLYAGVGSIGLSVASEVVTLVEADPATAAMARRNAEASPLRAEVIEASSETVTNYITGDVPVIVDPPRAGLHSRVIDRLMQARPPRITYLSCNPVTQARDAAVLLAEHYTLTHFDAFNFFPHTPHIETLMVLERR